MNKTKAESFAVDSVAWRTRSQESRRFMIARISAPVAPMAPPSVGVASPMKIVPSTRKIRNRGGTIAKVTCCASRDRKRNLNKRSQVQLSTATANANTIALNIDSTTKSAPWVLVSRITNQPNTPLTTARIASEGRPRLPSSSRKPTSAAGRPGAVFGYMMVIRKM